MSPDRADVIVLGAGPAGAAAALNLAPTRRVVVVERRMEPVARIGETLIPAARRLLRDMGLLDEFLAEGHAPCYGTRSVWGSPAPAEADFMRSPDGTGFHLDRPRFDAWLQGVARRRGAEIVAPGRVVSVARRGSRWRTTVDGPGGGRELEAAVVIDAAGRGAPLGRRLGGRRVAADKLVARWVTGTVTGGRGTGITFVEAVAGGWWYTAPLPGGRRVLAFHTDADLHAARPIGAETLVTAALGVGELARVLTEAGFAPDGPVRVAAACSAALRPCAGPGWLAAGDASMSFDPLASLGLFNALFTGLAAAEAADRQLDGDAAADAPYRRVVAGIASEYRRNLANAYAGERRWPEAPFWRRRQQTGPIRRGQTSRRAQMFR